MKRYSKVGQELNQCVASFCALSGKSEKETFDIIVNSTENFDMIMFKHENTEMFYSLNNQNQGTLIIS